MQMKKFRTIISFLLAVTILFSWVPAEALEVEQGEADSAVATSIPAGKTLSILGDSISTFKDHSNGAAAKTTNSTIGSGAVYYPRSGFDVTAESTWWYQAAEALGMEILVNNSWSGSCLLNERSGTVGAYLDRCVQLHDDTGDNAGQKPDIIAIFLGTNDYYTYPGTLGSYEAIDFDKLIQHGEDGYTYTQPATSLEAYAIILHKISRAYPDAEVYCFTLLPRVNSGSQPAAFNEDLCQLAEHFGVYTVDLYDCGIRSDSEAFYMLMGDNLHPDDPGMDAITNAFVSAVLKNGEERTCDISFTLEDTVAMEGTTRTVVSGDGFETQLAPLDASLPLEITVTMGGADITERCRSGNTVKIPSVTADVVITAKPGQREPANFRWELKDNALVSVTAGGNAENNLTMTHGTITDGTFSKTRFTMSQGISLRHDLPWCVEWKSSGTWTDTTDGALLFSEASTSSTADAYYFYRRHNNDFFAFGSNTGGKYHNYGVKFAGTGIDTTAEHVFRLENRIASDGSNMIYLLVDDGEVGPLNHHWIGGTDQKETVDWVSGKDFTFSYMGTSPHTIGGCKLQYVQVWENGIPHEHDYTAVVTKPTYTSGGYTTYTCQCGDSYVDEYTDPIQLFSYRWEMQNNGMVSVSANGNTANPLTLTSGSVSGNTFSKARYSLQTNVQLHHDVPWVMEWRSTGNWSGMLFGSSGQSPSDGLIYLFRDSGSRLFAFGEYTGVWNNYGIVLNCDMTVPHVFRLENRIAPDGTNGVYLLVDGQEMGAMHHHYKAGTNQNATVNWANGKDITFSSIGTTSHPMSGMQLDYLQIWEKGHNHSYQSVVTAPTCTEKGYTTYTCACGDSYADDFTEPHSAAKVTDAAIKANSLRPGLTEGSHCSACGAVLEPQEEIPAKGYDWMLEDGEFKILLIGNSFSQDASSCGFGMTESQLYNMLQAMLGEDIKVTLGLLYSGGKGVHWYATQTEQGTKAPSFYTITPEKTVWTSRGGTSTETAITWTDWDVVTLQPYDVNFTKEQEGVPEKYKAETDEKFYPLETATEYMLDFIGTHAPQADVYCYMHWARSSATVASLNASLSTYQKFAAFYPKGLDYLGTETGNRYAGIIPVGLSIQNARTTYLSTLSYNIGATVDLQNDPQIGLQRDGGHVTYNVGRYIAGLTFAETLIPVELRAEGYVLPGIRVTESVGKLPEKYTEVAQKAVFAAVESWRNGSLEVTNLEEYAQDPAVSAKEELESTTLNLTCADENALIAQIREKVLGELPAEFVVEAVVVDVEKNTALITLRFGYTSVEAEMAYILTDHNFENGTCTLCGAAAPSPYAGKTIACIGDSITYGVGVTRDQTDYVTLLAKSLEMDYIRLGASGTTLCTGGHATCNIGKLTEANLAGADVVTVLMGINDFVQARNGYYALGTIDSTDTSTIYGAAHMWCQRIYELRKTDSLKNTEFYFMTPVITSWNNSVSSVRDWNQGKENIHGYTLRDLCNAVIEVCALYDIPVIDLNLISGLYYNSPEDNSIDKFGGDGAHPGTVGHQMMASAIENALLKNHLLDDHDHSYGSWITTTYPDCESGVQKRVCTICTAVEEQELAGTGHHYENGVCTDCGIVHTSTFQILDTRCGCVETFTYEVGMTWKEWLNSGYNTGMGSAVAIWVSEGPDFLGYNSHMDIFVNGDPMDYNDVICEQDGLQLVRHY